MCRLRKPFVYYFQVAACSVTLACGCSGKDAVSEADATPPAQPQVLTASAAVEETRAGNASLEAGDYEQAVEQFTLAINASGLNAANRIVDNSAASLYLKRGIAYLRMGFPDTAKEDFSDAVALTPNDPAPYEQRAVAYRQLGDLYNAVRDATHAIRLNPRNAPAYHARGLVYLRREQFDRAVADLEQTIAEDPSLAAVVTPQLGEAYFRWSRRLEEDGDATGAVEKLARAEQLNPDYVLSQRRSAAPAEIEVEVVEQTVAKPVINEAIEHFNRGRELQIRGENDQALIEFTEAIALDRTAADPYLRRGETLLAMGFPDSALEDLQSAEDRRASKLEVHRLMARTHLALDSPHRAAMSATDALHDSPTDASMYALRGEAYLRMENWERAIADLEEAIRRDPQLERSLTPALAAARKGLATAQAKKMQTAYSISE